MSIQVTPLSEAPGAEITGVDLAQERGPDGFDIINRAWLRHKVILFRIKGLDGDESRHILDRLFDHAEQSRFIFEHAWKPGDLVMWDDLAVMHVRTDFDPAEGRVLRRVAVKCPRPLGVDGRG